MITYVFILNTVTVILLLIVNSLPQVKQRLSRGTRLGFTIIFVLLLLTSISILNQSI
ncbi:hypothetical protein D3C78_17550 [compost metagenome]